MLWISVVHRLISCILDGGKSVKMATLLFLDSSKHALLHAQEEATKVLIYKLLDHILEVMKILSFRLMQTVSCQKYDSVFEAQFRTRRDHCQESSTVDVNFCLIGCLMLYSFVHDMCKETNFHSSLQYHSRKHSVKSNAGRLRGTCLF